MRLRITLLALALLAWSACRSSKAPPKSEATGATRTTVAPVTSSPVAEIGQLLAGPKTYAVIVGVLSFADPGVAGWSKDRRKDRELHEALRARGVPAENMALILDDEAQHQAVLSAVARMSKRAGPDSTLLFYYAGHGVRDGEGHPYFVAFDSRGADMPNTGIAIAKVAATVRQHFEGERVLFMADACYSGALKDAAEEVARSGKVKAASLTSADASNLSTNNWTFTQTILDGLAGDGLMDGNADGAISFGELSGAVGDAMKFREKQRHGFFSRGIDEALLVAPASSGVAGAKKEALGHYVMAPRPSGEAVAQIRSIDGARRMVRFYDYNHATDLKVAASAVTPITFERHPVGSKLRVFWGKTLYDAEVLKAEGDFHFITYPGWGPEWNEWVMSDRIAHTASNDGAGSKDNPQTDGIEVEWRGSWWPASVLDQQGGRFLIHYDGYGPEWDEWVTEARIRRKVSRRSR